MSLECRKTLENFGTGRFKWAAECPTKVALAKGNTPKQKKHKKDNEEKHEGLSTCIKGKRCRHFKCC